MWSATPRVALSSAGQTGVCSADHGAEHVAGRFGGEASDESDLHAGVMQFLGASMAMLRLRQQTAPHR